MKKFFTPEALNSDGLGNTLLLLVIFGVLLGPCFAPIGITLCINGMAWGKRKVSHGWIATFAFLLLALVGQVMVLGALFAVKLVTNCETVFCIAG